MIAPSPVTLLTCISWQPRDCTLETGTAPNSRSYCPRYVTFPSYKPSGEWALLSCTTVVVWNQCRMQTGREFRSRFVMAALLWSDTVIAIAVMANATEGISNSNQASKPMASYSEQRPGLQVLKWVIVNRAWRHRHGVLAELPALYSPVQFFHSQSQMIGHWDLGMQCECEWIHIYLKWVSQTFSPGEVVRLLALLLYDLRVTFEVLILS
jgi:hypothetical protein